MLQERMEPHATDWTHDSQAGASTWKFGNILYPNVVAVWTFYCHTVLTSGPKILFVTHSMGYLSHDKMPIGIIRIWVGMPTFV